MASVIARGEFLAIVDANSLFCPSIQLMENIIYQSYFFCSLSRNHFAENIISLAKPLPTNFGSLCVPPYPGIRPKVTSGNPNLAVSDA